MGQRIALVQTCQMCGRPFAQVESDRGRVYWRDSCSKLCHDRLYYRRNKAKWQTEPARRKSRERAREQWARAKADPAVKAKRYEATAAWYKRNAEDRTRQVRDRYARNKTSRPCAVCGRSFMPTKRQWGFCSDECKAEQTRRHGRATQHKRRSVQVFKVTQRDIERLVRRHNGRCAYCQQAPYEHLDHVMPVARGGVHSIGNLLPACGTCNRSKADKLLAHWRSL